MKIVYSLNSITGKLAKNLIALPFFAPLAFFASLEFFASLAIALTLSATPTDSIAQSTAQSSSTQPAIEAADSDAVSSSLLDLSSNECLQKLNPTDIVIASIAFKDGLDSSDQFKELVNRRPWGVGTPETSDEIKAQLETESPFLIITLTKEQVLTLDDHRDIIRWVLVQSPTRTCE